MQIAKVGPGDRDVLGADYLKELGMRNGTEESEESEESEGSEEE